MPSTLLWRVPKVSYLIVDLCLVFLPVLAKFSALLFADDPPLDPSQVERSRAVAMGVVHVQPKGAPQGLLVCSGRLLVLDKSTQPVRLVRRWLDRPSTRR